MAKSARFIGIAVCLVVLHLSSAKSFAASGYIHELSGEVKTAVGKDTLRTVKQGDTLDSDTTITTGGKSTAVLKFEDGQVVALPENSTFRVNEYRYTALEPQKSSIVFSLIKGGLRAITGLIASKNHAAFKLHVGATATIGIRGTDLSAVLVGNTVFATVDSGIINLSNQVGETTLTQGQHARVLSATAAPTRIPTSALPADIFKPLKAISVPAPTPVSVSLAAKEAADTPPPPEPELRQIDPLVTPPATGSGGSSPN